MLDITKEFKDKVIKALLLQRKNFDGTDEKFAKQWGINKAAFNRLKKGQRDKVIADNKYLNIGRRLNVTLNETKWNMAKTKIFTRIKDDIVFCQNNSKARILVGDVGLGKSYAAKYLSLKLKNCFYIDCKQAKSKQKFIRLLCKTVGVDDTGKYEDVKENLKYYLNLLPKPIVITDDSGFLKTPAFEELLELWDATENICGWYQIGDDSLRQKIDRGIAAKKLGYNAMFSRYSKRYSGLSPTDRLEKRAYYEAAMQAILDVNYVDKKQHKEIIRQCLVTDVSNGLGDLRRLNSLILIKRKNTNK